ncbi:MAG: hypothetical protein KAR40_04855 [Candidatus Sabulitectum sp.]|nr:hypothetical protein [Candidatus Sabulitectum sp.]
MEEERYWSKDFPLQQEAEDFAGRIRIFTVDCIELPMGYTVRAVENSTDYMGYLFESFSETSPYSALGKIRDKIRKALATRHITKSDYGYNMMHDELQGRITCDAQGEPALIVDGSHLTLDDLGHIFSSSEGFEFSLKIKESLL